MIHLCLVALLTQTHPAEPHHLNSTLIETATQPCPRCKQTISEYSRNNDILLTKVKAKHDDIATILITKATSKHTSKHLAWSAVSVVGCSYPERTSSSTVYFKRRASKKNKMNRDQHFKNVWANLMELAVVLGSAEKESDASGFALQRDLTAMNREL